MSVGPTHALVYWHGCFCFQDYNYSLVSVIQKSFSPFLSLSLTGQTESLAASNDCLKQQEGWQHHDDPSETFSAFFLG